MLIRLLAAVGMLAFFVFGSYWAYDASRLYVFQSGFTGSAKYVLLFDSAFLLIPLVIFLGVFLGSISGKRQKTLVKDGKVLRHSETVFFQHWFHAMATILLIGTGILLGLFFLPRFVSGPENAGFVLNLHFIGVCAFLFTVSFHVTRGLLSGEMKENLPKRQDFSDAVAHYFSKAKPEEGKYFSSVKVSYLVWTILVSGIVLSGLFKVSAYVWDVPGWLAAAATIVHDLFTVGMVVMLIIHITLGAVLPSSRPLLKSMFTGYVSEEYVKENHVKWYREIMENMNRKKDSPESN